jgi:DNA-binding MarR family transcriptional regulator
VGEVAARIGARGSPASRLISRLKQRGVVLSERDAVDHRIARIRLSERGRELRRKVLDHRRRDLESMAGSSPVRAVDAEDLRSIARAFEAFS